MKSVPDTNGMIQPRWGLVWLIAVGLGLGILVALWVLGFPLTFILTLAVCFAVLIPLMLRAQKRGTDEWSRE